MGDVAQILKNTQASSGSSQALPKAVKLSGISREVQHLLSGKQDPKSADLPPIVPFFSRERATKGKGEDNETTTNTDDVKTKVGNKWISSSKKARQWTWAPFASSSRTDGAKFRHWVRANVEYTDYPYAKFDIHLDAVAYSDDEYVNYLKSDRWTRSETDKLMELVRTFELRWAVIHDRWLEYFQSEVDPEGQPTRNVEDLQDRYYNVAAILSQIRIRKEAAAEVQALASMQSDLTTSEGREKAEQVVLEAAAARALATAAPKTQPLITNLGTGSSNKLFDVTYERERRAHLDRMWRRNKDEENEELELRKELRAIDAQLRKLKKSGGHILAANGASIPGASSSRNPSRSVSPVPGVSIVDNPEALKSSFASTAPIPMPQTPYLQSGRLVPPATGGSGGLNKTMLTRMNQVLTELKVPEQPLPTKRVCDVYDAVRKDILVLITLQKMIMQKEGNIQTRTVRLSKLGGGEYRTLDEEALLGIAPPPAPPSAPAPSTKKQTKSASKSKASSASKGKASQSKSKQGDTATEKADGKDGPAKKKAAPKRKRKSDAGTKDAGKKSPAPGSNQAATAAGTSTKAASGTSPKAGSGTSTTTKSKQSTKSSASKTPTTSESAKKRARKS